MRYVWRNVLCLLSVGMASKVWLVQFVSILSNFPHPSFFAAFYHFLWVVLTALLRITFDLRQVCVKDTSLYPQITSYQPSGVPPEHGTGWQYWLCAVVCCPGEGAFAILLYTHWPQRLCCGERGRNLCEWSEGNNQNPTSLEGELKYRKIPIISPGH